MYLGKVIGKVVCTVKNTALAGKKILIVQPLDRHARPTGKPLIALDSVGAGAGETIYWARGREATLAWLGEEIPTETAIVGIVDEIRATLARENKSGSAQ